MEQSWGGGGCGKGGDRGRGRVSLRGKLEQTKRRIITLLDGGLRLGKHARICFPDSPDEGWANNNFV